MSRTFGTMSDTTKAIHKYIVTSPVPVTAGEITRRFYSLHEGMTPRMIESIKQRRKGILRRIRQNDKGVKTDGKGRYWYEH